MAPANTEQSLVKTLRQDMSPPPDNAFLDMQDMVSPVEDSPPVALSGH